MRELALKPNIAPGPYVDIVGTGGDGSHSLNLSTGSALLAAACGVPVVKHGNRSVSSRCGSADVLGALGLPIPLDERAAGECLARVGFTFLFAPHYHPAMKHIAPVRQALGVRTVFNILGPLVNPAAPPYHVIGAFSDGVAALMAETLAGMSIGRTRDSRPLGLGRGDAAGPFICSATSGPESIEPASFATRATMGRPSARSRTCARRRRRDERVATARGAEGGDTAAHRNAADFGRGARSRSRHDATRTRASRAREALASGAGRDLVARVVAFGQGHAK
jgi:anthranilate phosphoribosyltransferase